MIRRAPDICHSSALDDRLSGHIIAEMAIVKFVLDKTAGNGYTFSKARKGTSKEQRKVQKVTGRGSAYGF